MIGTRAMMLAAGLGTRMRPLTLTRPKPLIVVAGRSLLDRGVDSLQASGVSHVVVNKHTCRTTSTAGPRNARRRMSSCRMNPR